MPAPVSPERVLLVEGPDDEHVVRHLLKHSGGMPRFCIIQKDGIDNLLPAIPVELNVSGRRTLGILVDANDNPEYRWRALMHSLSKLNVDLPNKPDANGTIIESRPRVGIWMMPDNQASGELENFVAAMIPQGDPVWPRAQAYVCGISEIDRRFSSGKTLRAKVHAWLAARENPRKMGSAIGAGDLDVNVAVSKRFVAWLEELFA